jgi:hypothetical protein
VALTSHHTRRRLGVAKGVDGTLHPFFGTQSAIDSLYAEGAGGAGGGGREGGAGAGSREGSQPDWGPRQPDSEASSGSWRRPRCTVARRASARVSNAGSAATRAAS